MERARVALARHERPASVRALASLDALRCRLDGRNGGEVVRRGRRSLQVEFGAGRSGAGHGGYLDDLTFAASSTVWSTRPRA